jgi:murein DD-endopeptidase MepM/ murein hydrolase activator NlpD
MGRAWRLAVVVTAALVVAVPASAMTDGGVGLSLEWPAQGVGTRGFGYDPTMGESHPGIDIGTLSSLDVRAAASGVVAAVGYAPGFEGYGNVVLVDLGFGLQVLYAHLSSVRVAAGDWVWAGELLGQAGAPATAPAPTCTSSCGTTGSPSTRRRCCRSRGEAASPRSPG